MPIISQRASEAYRERRIEILVRERMLRYYQSLDRDQYERVHRMIRTLTEVEIEASP